MFKNSPVLLLLLCSFSVLAIESKILTQSPESQSPWIVRAYYETQQQLQAMSDITPLWNNNEEQGYAVLMINDKLMYNKIQSLKVQMRLDTKLQTKYFTENQKLKSSYEPEGGDTISGFSCYSTVEGTFSRMQALVASHASLAEIIDVGVSWEKTINANNGYDLKILRLTNQNITTKKPIVFMTSAIHAREYTTAELTTRFAEYLLSQYETNSDVQWILDHHEVQLMLQTNPDGRKKAESGILWRKNTNQAYCSPNSNNRGADLNRNYPFEWQSGFDECGGTYPGPSAQSEPELMAVINHLDNIFEDKRGEQLSDPADADTPGVFLDIHSSGRLVMWPWGFTPTDNPNVNQYQAFGRRVAFYNNYTPQPITDLTIANGSSVDHSYGKLGVASLAFELGTQFFEECDLFESTILPDNLESLLYVTRVARTPYITPLGPDIESLSLIPNYILPDQNFTVSGIANEDRYNSSRGTQIFEQVKQVDTYINDLPWLSKNAQSVPASDGVYDSGLESFEAEINSSKLPIGQHTVFAVAKDSNDVSGAIFSKFVNVVDENQVGTISGIVLDAITGAPVNVAQIKINESIGLSGNTGQYSLFAPPKNGTLSVEADGYAKIEIQNLEIIQQMNTTQNIQLEPFCDVFSDDVESGANNWLANAPWAIVNNQSSSPISSWTDSPDGEYDNDINTSITSENINITGASSLELSFNHLCTTEAGFDFGHAEVNFDNSNWQTVFTCDGESEWKSVNQSMSVPDDSKQMQIRFRLTSDSFVTQDGWYVDDINIKASGQPCRNVLDDNIFTNGFEQIN